MNLYSVSEKMVMESGGKIECNKSISVGSVDDTDLSHFVFEDSSGVDEGGWCCSTYCVGILSELEISRAEGWRSLCSPRYDSFSNEARECDLNVIIYRDSGDLRGRRL